MRKIISAGDTKRLRVSARCPLALLSSPHSLASLRLHYSTSSSSSTFCNIYFPTRLGGTWRLGSRRKRNNEDDNHDMLVGAWGGWVIIPWLFLSFFFCFLNLLIFVQQVSYLLRRTVTLPHFFFSPSAPIPLMSIHAIQSCSKWQRWGSSGLDTTATRRNQLWAIRSLQFAVFTNVEDAVAICLW